MSLPNLGAIAASAVINVILLNMVYVFADPQFERPLGVALSLASPVVLFLSLFLLWSYGFWRTYSRRNEDPRAVTTKHVLYSVFAPVVSSYYFLSLDKDEITVGYLFRYSIYALLGLLYLLVLIVLGDYIRTNVDGPWTTGMILYVALPFLPLLYWMFVRDRNRKSVEDDT